MDEQPMTEKEQLEELKQLTEYLVEVDEDLYWSKCDDGLCRPHVNVNGFFYWGAADAETIYAKDLPDIHQAYQDIIEATPEQEFSDIEAQIYHLCLWVARKRKMRPQGAAYPKEPKGVIDLFNQCGPIRSLSHTNPKEQP